MSHGKVILYYMLPRSSLQQPARGSCFRDTIILVSSNRGNEIEMHSACLRPLSCPPGSSFFRWKKTDSEARRVQDVCTVVLPSNISIRMYCIYRIYRRTLPTPWIVRQRWFCSRNPRKRWRRTTEFTGKAVWFSFHDDSSPPYPLCKEYAAEEDEKVKRYRRVASKRTADERRHREFERSRLDCPLCLR